MTILYDDEIMIYDDVTMLYGDDIWCYKMLYNDFTWWWYGDDDVW